jgi:phage terminase large subunit
MRAVEIETPRVFAPLLEPARYRAAYGGRGSGKSHFFGDLLIERFLLAPTTRAVCIREIQQSLEQSVKRLLEDKIQALGVGPLFHVGEADIRTKQGGIAIFKGMQNHTAESMKSLEGYDVAWVEEAQSLSQRSLDLLRPTIRKDGSELWFSWNPRYETDPIDRFLRASTPPESTVVRANYTDNPWLPDVLKREAEWDRTNDPDKYAHIWLGEYERHSEARVFKNWTIEAFETPHDATFYYGGDWGFSIDPTVLVRVFLNREARTLYVDREVFQVGCEIDHTPALFDQLDNGQARKYVITADSARPETISYMQRHGYPRVKGAVKGPGSLEEGITFLQNFAIKVHPRCRHAIDELTLYSYERDRLTGNVLPKLADKKNHVIDALRYAVESLRIKTGAAFFHLPGL